MTVLAVKAPLASAIQTTTRLLDWFDPIHDPSGIISRTVLKLDQLAAKRGVRLYPQTDNRALKTVTEAYRHLGTVLSPNADPDYSRIDSSNAFWILGLDSDGQVATTQAGRYMDWTGSSLADEVEAFRYFYETPEKHLTEECYCRVPRPAAEQITGPVMLSGTIWVRPDMRGPDAQGIVLSQLLGRLTRMIGLAQWWPDFLFTFSSNDHYKRGVVTNFGWAHHEFPVEWKLAGLPVYRGGLFWMTRGEMMDWAATDPVEQPGPVRRPGTAA